MNRKRSIRAPFVVTMTAAAMVGGCGGQVEGGNPPPQSDAGPVVGGQNPPAPTCPTEVPSAADSCDLPDGRMCTWGAMCDPISAECTGGRWLFGSSNPPAIACPATAPTPGDDCSALCLPPGFSCTFPNVDCPGSGSGTTLATCDNGVWGAVTSTCSGPTEPDAGDVDATADADLGD